VFIIVLRALHDVDFSSWQGKNARLICPEQIEQLCWPKGRRAGARSKKRSLQFVNEYFKSIFNAAMAEKMLRAKLSW
jgi:hypothetical protein